MPALPEIAIPPHLHELLAGNIQGTLSTIRHSDGLISTNPVGYVWDGERVLISTLKSRIKYRNLVANPLATFCVISPSDGTKYVEIRGYATLADDTDRSFLRRQFGRAMRGDPPPDLDPPGSERVIITLHPQQVSSPTLYGGRFSKST